jgi:hypothetical protein
MSLLSILVLMLILYDHMFTKQISSRSLRLALIISFTSINSVLSIHHEFEESIGYVLAFSIIVFIQEVLCIFSPLSIYIFGHLTLK